MHMEGWRGGRRWVWRARRRDLIWWRPMILHGDVKLFHSMAYCVIIFTLLEPFRRKYTITKSTLFSDHKNQFTSPHISDPTYAWLTSSYDLDTNFCTKSNNGPTVIINTMQKSLNKGAYWWTVVLQYTYAVSLKGGGGVEQSRFTERLFCQVLTFCFVFDFCLLKVNMIDIGMQHPPPCDASYQVLCHLSCHIV